MAKQLADSRATALLNERLERELEIASRIQTSILPRDLAVPELEISARMIPASEVGGDYYDVLPVDARGCWIGIGDVAGHGLTAGLVMLMMQSVVAALVKRSPDASPREIVSQLNVVLYENIRHRLCQDEHATMCLLRHHGGGKVTYAGAHEEIAVFRKATGRCELVRTPGTWLGAKRDIADATVDSELELATGDVMVLFTDGITEAGNAKQEMYGDGRLLAAIEGAATLPVDQIRDRVMDDVRAWMSGQEQADDLTIVVVRRT
jgi:phosphoserine phosphatase RsbU/P